MKQFKTNALRILDKQKITYAIKEYRCDEEHLSGDHIIEQVDMQPEQIYKTLVLQDNNKQYLVCCIPVFDEIDLKKLAKVAKAKSVNMIHQKDLLNITGYIRGGCSPIGMKKVFPTYFDQQILNQKEVAFSAGKRGYQMIVNPIDLINYLNVVVESVVK